MTYCDAQQIRQEIIIFVAKHPWQNPYAVTLNLKQRLPKSGLWLTWDLAQQNNRYFLKFLNRKLFGNAVQRYGRELPLVACPEWRPGKRLHYHMLIDCPVHVDEPSFKSAISSCWAKTLWGYGQEDIERLTDIDGWLRYMSKERNAAVENIEWENVVLPTIGIH